jgi:penicillin-binding protein 1A
VVQGGSSLSQQLAKNLFLSNERTLERKIKEAFLALWLEANLSKQEILKLYLDRAYMGGGNFGVEAASEFYFGKSVKDVNLAEAALLAGLFKAPARYAPHVNLPAARARANEVLSNMVQAGFLTEGQVIGARRRPADVVDRANQAGSPDYFMDWAYNEVKKMRLGGDRSLIVRSTVDLGMQKTAEDAVETVLREQGDTFGVKQAAVVAMDPDGAAPWSAAATTARASSTAPPMRSASRARRSSPTSALAMMNGYTPESVVRDALPAWATGAPRTTRAAIPARSRSPLRSSSRSTSSRSSSPIRSRTAAPRSSSRQADGVRPNCTRASRCLSALRK